MEILPYQSKFERRWDDFVWQALNGTIFHTRRFLSYHPPDRFQDHSLIFLKKGKWVSILPAVLKYHDGSKMLISHSGASYGGFVVDSRLGIRDFFELVDTLVDYCYQQDFNRIEMTLPPIIYLKKPSHYLDFALMKKGFFYKKRELSSVISLDFPPDEVLNTFKNEARTAVRKSLRSGVKIRESEDLPTFYEILKRNLKLRHNVTPTHTVEELVKLKELFPKRIRLFSAYLDEKMIAGVVIFLCNERVALAFYISHIEEYQRYRSVNLLFFEIIKWAIGEGIKYIDFGIFTVEMEPNWGLGRFKETFGAKGIFRDTFIAEVPDLQKLGSRAAS